MDNSYEEEIEKLLKDTDDIDFTIRKLKFENRGLTATNDKEIDRLEKEMENVVFKMKDAFIKTGNNKVQTYIKTSYTLQLNPLKKAIEDGSIVLKEMTRETGKKKFVYKYTGGNK